MKYVNDALRMAHRNAEAMFEHGLISVEEMKEMDRDCLTPVYAALMKRGQQAVTGALVEQHQGGLVPAL